MKQPGSGNKKKKVTWSDDVHNTLDAETAYYAATLHADIFATVDDTQIPITPTVPARPDATEAVPVVKQCTPPNTPVHTTSVASTKAAQRVRSAQALNSLKSPITQATN